MLVELRQAVFGYSGRPVVQVEQLTLQPGRCVGVFGPNGSGKTTLVRGIIGLLKPMSGHVGRTTDTARNGYLPQYRHIDQHWPMTGFDAASLAVSAHRRLGWVGRQSGVIENSLRRLNVLDLAGHRFSKLSGGQQQRILLAGALAADPMVLVLDEPTDGLDVHSRRTLLDLLLDSKRSGLCIVLISHDVQDLLTLADDVAWFVPPDEPNGISRVEVLSPAEVGPRLFLQQAAI